MSKGYPCDVGSDKPGDSHITYAEMKRRQRKQLHCTLLPQRRASGFSVAEHAFLSVNLCRICLPSNGLDLSWMEERRKFPRTESNEPAYVSSGGSVMRCVVRNISREGAAIDVEEPAFVPPRFRLVMANDASDVHECRITWIQKNRIGLTFVDDG
jgi:hypothetical protein